MQRCCKVSYNSSSSAAVVILSGKREREAGTKAVNRVTVDWGEHACVS